MKSFKHDGIYFIKYCSIIINIICLNLYFTGNENDLDDVRIELDQLLNERERNLANIV